MFVVEIVKVESDRAWRVAEGRRWLWRRRLIIHIVFTLTPLFRFVRLGCPVGIVVRVVAGGTVVVGASAHDVFLSGDSLSWRLGRARHFDHRWTSKAVPSMPPVTRPITG